MSSVSSAGSSGSSSSAYSSTYNINSRVTGMLSNMDTDSIVKGLCSNQQAKIDDQVRAETKYKWYDDAVQSAIDSITTFSNTYCSVLGSSSMLKSSAYYTYKITSDSTSHAVSLAASGQVLSNNVSVKVDQLAKNATMASSGKVSSDGTEISSSNTATLAELSLATPLTFSSGGKISFDINGKTFSFSKDTTLQKMINTINSDTTANVTMTYSRLNDTFSIAADSGGKKSSVSINNLSGNAFGENSAFKINTGMVKNGQNSIAEINGNTIERDSNNYEIDNVTYTLNKVTKGTEEETIGFTLEHDYSSTVDGISKFVDAFNTLLTSLSSQSTATDYSADYPPLTDAQRAEMTESQITAWETKSKNGILSGDSNLKSLVSSIRNAFFTSAGGTGESATSIGFSSGGYFSTDKGKIVFDTDKLTKALEANPENVISIFTGGSTFSDGPDQGVIYKIKNAITTYQKDAKDSIASTKIKIKNTGTDITKLKSKLDTLATKYYNKFSAMETALSKLNSQSSYISQLLG